MNLLQQFNALFQQENRGVAKIITQEAARYHGKTTSGTVWLTGMGYKVGDSVFYDKYTGRIVGMAPDLMVVELVVN